MKKEEEEKSPVSWFCFWTLFIPFLQGKKWAHCLFEHFSRFSNIWWLQQSGCVVRDQQHPWWIPCCFLLHFPGIGVFQFPQSLRLAFSAALEAFLKFPSCMPALSRSLWYSWGGNRDSAIYFSVLAGRSIHSSYLTNVYWSEVKLGWCSFLPQGLTYTLFLYHVGHYYGS